MSEAITITLPYPPRELSPNGRCYFMKKHRLTQQYKGIAKLAARYAKPKGHKPLGRATTQVVYYMPAKRKMDHDNAIATLKAAFDGIALAGVIENDSGLSHKPPQFEVDKEKPRVEITISPLA